MDVDPKCFSIPVDPAREQIGQLPRRDNINYYNTFSIVQEFERAAHFGGAHEGRHDCWRLTEGMFHDHLRWQYPYLRHEYGASREEALAAANRVSRVINEGIHAADAFIITLGLTEVWFNSGNDLAVSMQPQRGVPPDALYFRSTGFDENLANLRRTLALIRSINPQAPVFLSVSPVPLGKTFTDKDVVVANMQSKATLRAAAGEVADSEELVHYFPAFELALWDGESPFIEDRRHVKPDVVERITGQFIDSYLK